MHPRNLLFSLLATILILLGFGSIDAAQDRLPLTDILLMETGLHGVILNDTGEAAIGASVGVFQNGSLLTGTTTDIDGRFSILLSPGIYQLQASYAGLSTAIVESVRVRDGEMLEVPVIQLTSAGTQLPDVVVTEYKVPPMSVDETTQGCIIDGGEIRKLGSRNVNAIARFPAGSPAAEEGSVISIRGGRTDHTRYMVDGILLQGSLPLSTAAPVIPMNDIFPSYTENGFTLPQNEPLSTFGVDVDAASYSVVRRALQEGRLPEPGSVRSEEMINYFSYDYAPPVGKTPVAFHSEVGPCPWNPAHRLLHVGVQAQQIATTDLPSSNLVFLIDVSGSMASPDKLPLVKSSLRLLVKQLRPRDRVSIVVYAGAAGAVLEPTSGDQKEIILDALERLEAGGSTAGAAGIVLAYQLAERNFIKDGNNRIILATDGDFNVGTTANVSLEAYIDRKRETGIFLSILGFGTGNYRDDRMQVLSESGNGTAYYVDNLLEAEKIFIAEFGGTLYTIAKDVKLQVEFNPMYVAAYRLIGYESRLLNPEDFNDDKKDAGDMGSGHSVTALYEISPVGAAFNGSTSTEPLRYQSSTPKQQVTASKGPQEWATIRMKYKDPHAKLSKAKIEQAVLVDSDAVGGDDVRWSAAVAAWSMQLNGSQFLPATFGAEELLVLAKAARGTDERGYRAEAIRLMELTGEMLGRRNAAGILVEEGR